MRGGRFVIAAAMGATLAGAPALVAQRPGGPPAGAPGAGARRMEMEQQVRQRFAQVVRQRLQLTDDQMRKLEETNQRYAPRLRDLVQEERSARLGLRDELLAGDRANGRRVDSLATRMLDLQRRRIDLAEEEQRDLSAFLTPVQRVKYLMLQEALRRRLEQVRPGQGNGRGMRGGAGRQEGAPPR